MSIRRTVQALVISALVVAGGSAGSATALAATQYFQGQAVDSTPEAALQQASALANAAASAAGYNPATQCKAGNGFVMQLGSEAWLGRVVVGCTG
ncbi:hypothetical protein ACIGNX_18300 [Actinosynnema sp. NPDC053489]|uniref:hypothetical protein n=1 Tax=Actinosynnema sp. NPDC053489 TaxID=3363916 RepID=UPI0037CAB4C3